MPMVFSVSIRLDGEIIVNGPGQIDSSGSGCMSISLDCHASSIYLHGTPEEMILFGDAISTAAGKAKAADQVVQEAAIEAEGLPGILK